MDSINEFAILQTRVQRGEKIVKSLEEMKKAQNMLSGREPATCIRVRINNNETGYDESYLTTVDSKKPTPTESALLEGIRYAFSREIERLNKEFKEI